TDAACGIDNGTLTIGAVTGGTAPYTYSVNGSPFTATASYTDLAAGSYTVIVRDANGCEFTATIAVATADGPSDVDINAVDATCGTDNGTLTIGTVTGGVAPYTYSVNGSPFTATTSYTDLAAGSYTVIVRDANGCEFTATTAVATADGPSDIELSSTDAACGIDNGTLTIGTVTGGVAPYTYSVNGSPF